MFSQERKVNLLFRYISMKSSEIITHGQKLLFR